MQILKTKQDALLQHTMLVCENQHEEILFVLARAGANMDGTMKQGKKIERRNIVSLCYPSYKRQDKTKIKNM